MGLSGEERHKHLTTYTTIDFVTAHPAATDISPPDTAFPPLLLLPMVLLHAIAELVPHLRRSLQER